MVGFPIPIPDDLPTPGAPKSVQKRKHDQGFTDNDEETILMKWRCETQIKIN